MSAEGHRWFRLLRFCHALPQQEAMWRHRGNPSHHDHVPQRKAEVSGTIRQRLGNNSVKESGGAEIRSVKNGCLVTSVSLLTSLWVCLPFCFLVCLFVCCLWFYIVFLVFNGNHLLWIYKFLLYIVLYRVCVCVCVCVCVFHFHFLLLLL